jgi:hypothetical protein
MKFEKRKDAEHQWVGLVSRRKAQQQGDSCTIHCGIQTGADRQKVERQQATIEDQQREPLGLILGWVQL